MTAAEDTPPLQADLSDVLRLVAELATVTPMGRRGRQILFALANAGHDVEKFEGVVVEGHVYNARVSSDWAACKCGDGKHEFRRDAPDGRGWWHEKRTDADADLKQAQRHHGSWYPNRPVPHLVTHLIATSTTERVA